MSLNGDLLRSSFVHVIEKQPKLTKRFYEILFERYPELKNLFPRRGMAAQEKMLGEALVAVLDHLEDTPWLQGQLGTLGRRHVDYGVTRAMYGQVGECLLAALAEAAGDDWTPAHERAWVDAYGAIRDMMLAEAA